MAALQLEEPVSQLELKKRADALVFQKDYAELIPHPKGEHQIATQNSFRDRVFKCREHLKCYKEAGDILVEMYDQILFYEDDLLKYGILSRLKKAYLCY